MSALRLRQLTLGTFLLLTSARGGSVEAQTEASWFFADVSFPAQVDGFVVVRTERWPEPGRGTVLHYETAMAPGATLDVHVQAIPQGIDEQEGVREDAQRTVSELARFRGSGSDPTSVVIDTVRSVVLEAGDRAYQGHLAEATLRSRNRTGYTLAYVFAKPPSFVRFRITYEPAQAAVLEPLIQDFLRGVLGRLESFQYRPEQGGP